MTALYPPPSDDAGREQLQLALRTVCFYARRALQLGADDDAIYDQVVTAITQVRGELEEVAVDVA